MLEESTGNFSASRNVYDWYQTNTHVILNIMIKNLTESDVKVRLIDETLDVTCTLANADEYRLHFNLFKPIYVSESSWTVTPSKLEIKLKKTDRKRWQSLEVIPEKGCKSPPSFNGVVAKTVTIQIQEVEEQEEQQGQEGQEEQQVEEGQEGEEAEEMDQEEQPDASLPASIKQETSEVTESQPEVEPETIAPVQLAPPPVAVPQQQSKNWDKIVKEFEEEEQKETNPTDGSVDELFREIYEKGGDEVRRAMNKSFTESAGTVLSTNWTEVGKDKVDMKAPDGVEFKKWDEWWKWPRKWWLKSI